MHENFINNKKTAKEALVFLDILASDAILFVVDDCDNLIGTLTDGDIRRGLIANFHIDDSVENFANKSPKYLRKGIFDIHNLIELRKNNYQIIPILEQGSQKISKLINFRKINSYLPVDAVIMAGGRGMRLSPLTDNTPKPLLKIGEKPIIEYNLDRLKNFGIQDFWVTIKYLGDQIKNYLGNGETKFIKINYITETIPMGTFGSVGSIQNFKNEFILVTNSDLLTNIDYEDFFCKFIESNADLSIATIPYNVDIPYAIFETEGDKILSLKEKPSYKFPANAGIYLFKRCLLDFVPKNKFYNATDFIELCIEKKLVVYSYPIHTYWLDIGKMDDFKKAQEDINHIKI